MPVDTSIYGGLLAQPKSAVDFANGYAQQQQNQLALAAARQQFGQTQQTVADTNALRAAIGSGLDMSTPEGASKAIAIAPTVAPALLKTYQDSATSRALAAKDTATASSTNWQTQVAKANKAISDISALTDPQQALASAQQHLQSGDIDQGKYQAIVSSLQPVLQGQSPFGQWQRQMVMGIMDAKDRIAATAPKITMTNAGGQIVPVNENADAGPVGAVPGAAPIPVSVGPDAALAAQTSRANNAAMIGAENARASNALEVEKAKVDPFGTLGINKNAAPGAAAGAGLSGDAYLATLPAGVASQVKAISEGKLQISPMSMRSPQGAALVQMAMQYEPGTDQTTYASRAATAKDAASGKLATSNNALNTLAGHLHDLSQAAAGLDNTRFPWVNSVKNFASNAAGNPQVRDFNLNLQGVADEFERAYRGAGGSEGSIAQWRANLGDSSSPEQFKAVLAKGAEMLQSKLEANQAQYEQGMSGKPGAYRSITPKAEAALAALRGGAAAPGAPPAAASPGFTITHIDGKPQ